MSKVFVGLSGGVDSAVSAALLHEAGHEVTGVFIKIWQPEFIECTWREDRLDAMRVAATLGIPFREIDLSDEYKAEVIDLIIADYQRGVTPNPDVLCNEKIKFGVFMRWALSEGAEKVATGHYARIVQSPEDGRFGLWKGIDPTKDQSYFVHRLKEADLAHILFPIGGMLKSDVRTHAKRFGLSVADKHDSQGLCFVGEVSLRDFLKRYIVVAPGNVVNQKAEIIGTHDGAALYTIGQRHGFVLSGSSTSKPQYVTGINTHTNTITVSENRDDAAVSSIYLDDIHWISTQPDLPLRLQVQTRYHEEPVSINLDKTDNRYRATFDSPHIVSVGQSMVFYDGDRCLGGAVMTK